MAEVAEQQDEAYPLVETERATATLMIAAKNKPGLVATATSFLASCNIDIGDIKARQVGKGYYMRIPLQDMHLMTTSFGAFKKGLDDLCNENGWKYDIRYGHEDERVAIMISETSHCLNALMEEYGHGTYLHSRFVCVISDLDDHRELVEKVHGLPFVHVPVPKGPRARRHHEEAIQIVLEDHDVDFIITARYMRIFTKVFVKRWWMKILNVHHALIPAFPGRNPYAAAFRWFVKVVGATAHYVFAKLDAGPVVAQVVKDASREGSEEEYAVVGRGAECDAITMGYRLHCEGVYVDQRKAITF